MSVCLCACMYICVHVFQVWKEGREGGRELGVCALVCGGGGGEREGEGGMGLEEGPVAVCVCRRSPEYLLVITYKLAILGGTCRVD